MRCLSLFLCSLLALNPVWAQTSPDTMFHVHIVDDPGPAPTQSTSGKGYVVQVTNASGAPVTGAAVALRLPEDGPTGRFANGLRAWVAYTDAAGIVRFPAIQWGEHAGVAEIRVTAAKGTYHSGLVVAQQIGPDHPTVSVVTVPLEAPPIVPKPVAPRLPQLALDVPEPGSVSKPLAYPTPPDIRTPSTSQSTIDLSGIAIPTSNPPAAATAPDMNVSRSSASAPTDKPHSLKPEPPAPAAKETEPQVTITNSPTGAGSSSHESHKKMWVLVAVGTGAGVATLLALHGHFGGGGGSSASSAGVTLGTPTIVVSH